MHLFYSSIVVGGALGVYTFGDLVYFFILKKRVVDRMLPFNADKISLICTIKYPSARKLQIDDAILPFSLGSF